MPFLCKPFFKWNGKKYYLKNKCSTWILCESEKQTETSRMIVKYKSLYIFAERRVVEFAKVDLFAIYIGCRCKYVVYLLFSQLKHFYQIREERSVRACTVTLGVSINRIIGYYVSFIPKHFMFPFFSRILSFVFCVNHEL